MTGWRDTRPANWAKTVTRLRKQAEDLRAHGWPVPAEPEDLKIPPHLRLTEPSPVSNT